MHLSQLISSERRSAILFLGVKKQSRIQLLRRLENDRWKYCNDCWSLHPHSTWRALQANWRLFVRPIQYDYLCDNLYAGEVDLCPCLTISFRDKICLLKTCKQLRQYTTVHSWKEYYNAFKDHSNIGNIGMLHEGVWHSCVFADHPSAKVKVLTVITESLKVTGSLAVRNRYKFIFNPPRKHNSIYNDNNSSHQTLISWLASSHPHDKSTRIWLEKFFNKEAGSSFFGWDKKDNHHRFSRPSIRYHWGEFNWESMVEDQYPQQPQSFELVITRNLGNDKWPNKNWNCHRRK